jgi:hypothetical protein
MVRQNDQQTTTGTSDTDAMNPAVAGGESDGALLRVQALVARGATPAEVADVIGPRPSPNVMAYLHQTVGNGFVQQVMFAGSGGGGGNPQPTPQPTAQPSPPTTLPSPPVLANGPQPQQSQQPTKYHPPANAFVVNVDGQYVQVYVSPDGVDTSPDVFMFFHGQVANLKIDPAMKDLGSDNVSGNDTAGAAMAKGKEKNTIALLPQGFRGGAHSAGGRMDAIIKYGLEKFLDDVLAAANLQIGAPSALKPHHISLAGHSAGGHKGIHEALSNTGKYADTISDITLMDTSYAETHFEEARDWAFTGSPNKTIRIVQGTGQLKNDIYRKQDDLEETDPNHKPAVYEGHAYWSRVFSDAALDTAVKAHPGMTINHIQTFDFQKSKSYGAGEDRGNMTEMVQHTQIVKDGKVQCDILVLHSQLGHHEIRDSTMDDAINSIGQGAAGSDQFGRHDDDPTYGRDPSKPHSGNSRTADEIKKDQAARDAKRKPKR